MTSNRSALAMLVGLGSLLTATTAQAEGGAPPDFGPPCTRADVEANPPAGDVPANWPAFTFVSSRRDELTWSTVRLVRVSDGVAVPFVSPYAPFSPASSLVVGEEYDLYHPICPGETPAVTRYRATAPIAEPTTLGTISVSQLYASNHFHGVANRTYFVEVRLDADAAFAVDPWAVVTWDVDTGGESNGFGSPLTRRLRVPIDCGSGVGHAPGDLAFRGLGYVVPAIERFSTPEVRSTVGPCAEALRVDDDTLRPLTPEEIAFWDSVPPPPDPFMDAMVGMDGGLDGGRVAMMTEADTNSNCSIGAIGTRRASYGAWALLLVVLVGVWRRPRRASRRD